MPLLVAVSTVVDQVASLGLPLPQSCSCIMTSIRRTLSTVCWRERYERASTSEDGYKEVSSSVNLQRVSWRAASEQENKVTVLRT